MVTEVAWQSPIILTGSTSNHVERIAYKGMSGGSKVDTYLVWSARFNPDLKQRTVIAPLKDMDMAACWFSGRACGMNRLENPVWYRPNRNINYKVLPVRTSGCQRTIDLEDVAATPLRRDFGSGVPSGREQHDSRRSTTQPVQRAGSGKMMPDQ
jgi:hypothetical protein